MLNWRRFVLLARDKFAAIRLKALSRLHIVPSEHSTILEVNRVAPLHIDYLPAEYYLDRGFHFLTPRRSN